MEDERTVLKLHGKWHSMLIIKVTQLVLSKCFIQSFMTVKHTVAL